jgi:hypothetical protein
MMDDTDPVMDDLVAAAANGDARTRANMRALVRRANQEQYNEGQNSHPQSHQRSFKKKTKWFGKSSSVLSASEDLIRDGNHIIQTKYTVLSASSQINDVMRKGNATSTPTSLAEKRSALASSFCQDAWRIVLDGIVCINGGIVQFFGHRVSAHAYAEGAITITGTPPSKLAIITSLPYYSSVVVTRLYGVMVLTMTHFRSSPFFSFCPF